jgi:predicted permease
MSIAILLKLVAIFAVVAFGWVAGRARWVTGPRDDEDVPRILGNAAFVLFMPALLFRTTARIDFGALPGASLAAFFVPQFALLLAVYALQRRSGALPVSGPSVRAITVTFGNTVQLGIPIAAALFDEAGLAVHLAIVSLHALLLLTLLTAVVEMDLARARVRAEGGSHDVARLLLRTARNTVIHPVVLPVVAGIGWNLAGLPLPEAVDEVLRLLGQAAVPMCLVIIGLSFAQHGLAGLKAVAGPAVSLTAAKLVLLPALVLAVGYGVLGLRGTPLAVIVMCAALPIGSNALLFAQRYDALTAETTVATVLSTLAFALTAPLWLLLVTFISPP